MGRFSLVKNATGPACSTRPLSHDLAFLLWDTLRIGISNIENANDYPHSSAFVQEICFSLEKSLNATLISMGNKPEHCAHVWRLFKGFISQEAHSGPLMMLFPSLETFVENQNEGLGEEDKIHYTPMKPLISQRSFIPIYRWRFFGLSSAFEFRRPCLLSWGRADLLLLQLWGDMRAHLQ